MILPNEADTKCSSPTEMDKFITAIKPLVENCRITRQPTNSNLPEIVDAIDFLQTNIEQPAELVEGILHKGSKLVLGGSSKSYKTWTLLDLSVSIATGVPWLGFPTKQGRVLYLNFEIQPAFFQKRIHEVALAKKAALKESWLNVWNLRGHACEISILIEQILDSVVTGAYSLVVFDPLYKLIGSGDENKASDMTKVMNAMERLAVETGCAIAFGSHYSKGNQAGKESIDRMSGSGVFARDPDSILAMTKHQEDDAFVVEATLRDFRPIDPFVVRRVHPLMVRDDSLDPGKLKQIGGRPAKHEAGMLLESLTTAMTAADWMEASEIPERTFYRLKKELIAQNKVIKVGNKWIKN